MTDTDKTNATPVVFCTIQSKDDRTMDVASSLQDEILSDFPECKRILRLVNEHVPPGDEKRIEIKAEDGYLSGYLVPDLPGPGGRKRPVSFLVEGAGWRNEAGQNISDLVCETIRKLSCSDEIPDAQFNEFRNELAAVIEKKNRRPAGCLCVILLFTAVAVAIFYFI